MKTKMLILAAFALVTLPSCMHPVDQVLHARVDTKQQTLETQGRISQGACDDVGQYAARGQAGITLESSVEASAQPLR